MGQGRKFSYFSVRRRLPSNEISPAILAGGCVVFAEEPMEAYGIDLSKIFINDSSRFYRAGISWCSPADIHKFNFKVARKLAIARLTDLSSSVSFVAPVPWTRDNEPKFIHQALTFSTPPAWVRKIDELLGVCTILPRGHEIKIDYRGLRLFSFR